MLDLYNRKITYLRISVTDRCNLRCTYCMPEEGVPWVPHDTILRFEEIEEIVRVAASLGVKKIRITGGEPLIRKGVPSLIGNLKKIEGIEFVGITTNGTLLRSLKKELARSGVDRVNVSLDTLDGALYKKVTRGGSIEQVIDGIEAMGEAGIPIKINMVVQESTSEREIADMKEFAEQHGATLQLIKEYRLTDQKSNSIAYHRPPPCDGCNRIRILANGTLKPCLHSNIEIPIDMDNIRHSLEQVVEAKPLHGTKSRRASVSEIGG